MDNRHNKNNSDAPERPLLEVDNVSVCFGGVQALSGVKLDVRSGEICGLIGPNGAGKTSLFNCITRLYGIDSGEIRLGGKRIDSVPSRDVIGAGIARTFQNLGIFSRMTVLENVLLGAHHLRRERALGTLLSPRYCDRKERELRDWGRSVLCDLGLERLADVRAEALPYATLKRVEIARALAARPRLLLLDEPAGGLTHGEVDEFGDLVARIRDSYNLTILIVEHHMGLVMSLCNRLVVLHLGRNLAQGTADEIRANPDVISAYLGRAAA